MKKKQKKWLTLGFFDQKLPESRYGSDLALKMRACAYVCVFVREWLRERKIERERDLWYSERLWDRMREGEREWVRDREWKGE